MDTTAGCPQPTPDHTTTRILDTALRRFSTAGIRATTIESIARAAEVDRTTIYRRYPTKDQLLHAVLTRELHRLHSHITATTRSLSDDEQVIEYFALAIHHAQTHPLLRRIRATASDSTLNALISGQLPETVRFLLQRHPRFTIALGQHASIIVETFVRLAISLITHPHLSARTPEQTRALARITPFPAVRDQLGPAPKRKTRPRQRGGLS
jgi:AcrR family transcriptional regulator